MTPGSITEAQSPFSEKRAQAGISLAFALAAVIAAAGAMGMPALVTLAALIALPRPALWAYALKPSPLLLAALAFLVWALVTQIWSPAEPRQILVVWAQAALGAGLLIAAAHLPEARRRLPRKLFVLTVAAGALFLALEAVSGGVVSAVIKGVEPGQERLLNSLTRGAAAMLILIPPAAVMARGLGGRWRHMAWAMLLGIFIAVIGFDADANAVALVITLAVFFLARRQPRAVVLAFGAAFSVWIVLFPLAVGLTDPLVGPRRDLLPFSWEWRWEAWTYTLELIRQQPWFGAGMDSARHFTGASVEMRGFILPRMPLHPHSASMQLWLELGAIGVFLVCAVLVLGARRIARAPDLGRARAAAATGTAVAAAFVLSTSYGFWQEWIWQTIILAAAACFLIGPGPDAEDNT